MFMFTARYKGQVQSILVHKEMKVQEFLDALSYSLQLPDGQIVGFQDRNGLIITPSFVCLNSQELRNETYDVLLKNPQQSNSVVSSLPTPTTSQPQLMLNREVSQLPHNSTLLFNTNLENLSPPVVQTYTQPRNNLNVQPVIESNQFNVASFGNTRNNAHADAPNFSNAQPAAYHEEEIIQFVMTLPTDPLLTENVKSKIIAKVRLRDSGIMGAYQMYLVDMDAEGFKARIIHRALSPQLLSGGNATTGDLYCSSATTAQVNWTNSRTSTAGGGFRPATRENSRLRNLNLHASLFQVPPQSQLPLHHSIAVTTQDRYLPVILELENKGFLNDEQTASLLKTLVLEENFEVFRVINSYLAKAISDRELSFRLTRLAQQLSTYIERPQSPLPRKKNQLLQYVNSLARYHFNDPDDSQLLNKLVQEENEFILSCFDVFESDKDHDNLIDSLKRILEKSKAMGLHRNSMTASSFYTNNNPWQRVNQNTINQANIAQASSQFPVSQSQTSLRFQQPYVSKWESNNISGFNSNSLFLQSMAGQPHFANQSQIPPFSQSQQSHHPITQSAPRSSERPQGAVGGRRTNGAGNGNPRNQQVPQHFQNTTVHNVALIPNYFSSGEEEAAAVQQQLRQNGRFTSLGNSQVKSTPLDDHRHHPHNFLHESHTPNNRCESFSQNSSSTRNNNNNQQHLHGYPKNQSDTESARQQISNGGGHGHRNYDEISAGVESRQSGQQPQPYQVKVQNYTGNGKQGGKILHHQSSESDFIEAIGNGGKKQNYQTNNVHHHHQQQNANNLKPPMSRQVAAQSSSYKNSTNKKSEQQRGKSKEHQASKHRQQKSKPRKHSSSESNSDEESESADSRAHHKNNHKKSHSQKKKKSGGGKHCTRDYSSSQSSSNSSSSSHSSSSITSDSSQSRKHHRGNSSKKHTSSKKHSSVPQITKEQIEKLIKRDKLRKNIASHIFSLFLHMSLTVKETHLLQMTQDLIQRETDFDFFSQYLASKAEDTLTQLMQINQITHEEQQRIKGNVNEKKIAKVFEKYSDKMLSRSESQIKKGEGYEIMAKVMQKLKKWADKSLAKEQLKISTQNSERIIHGSNSNKPPFQGTLRQNSQPYHDNIQKQQPQVSNSQPEELQAPATFNKQKLESNFQMIYYGEFLTKEQKEGAQVKQLYADKNFELLTLLSQYQKPSDYEALKSGIYELLAKSMPQQEEVKEPSFPPKSVVEAISLLEYQGILNQGEGDKLRNLAAEGDKRLKSTFECFQILKDFDDLTNSLCMLSGKGKVQKQANDANAAQLAKQTKAPVGQPKVQTYTPSYQPQGLINKNGPQTAPGSAGMGMISLMKIGGAAAQENEGGYHPQQVLSSSRRRKQSSEDDHNHVDEILEINDNPDESAGELESAGVNEDEMKSIEEFQQEIIQKYTLQGRFHYYDSLFFHQMVSKRDIRMISIFEVFAVNRNENDFLENMFIYKDLIFDSKNEEMEERAESDDLISDENAHIAKQEEENYPNLKYINQFRERLSEEEYLWSRQALMQEPTPNKTFIQIIECLKIMNDENDFVHSVKQLYKRHTQAMANAK